MVERKRHMYVLARDKPAPADRHRRLPVASRSDPQAGHEKRTLIIRDEESLACSGYTVLSHCPEIAAGVDRIAALVASMTIHLMESRDTGDVRIRNGLSRIVDIEPNRMMTRSTFVHWIVKTMLLDGNGNAVVIPVTDGGRLRELIPVSPGRVSFVSTDEDYRIVIDGREYRPEDVLHFPINPDADRPFIGCGYRVVLREVSHSLRQAATTKNGFMSSKWKPPLIIRVDAQTEALSSKDGRAKILADYVETNEAGQPWVLPAETMDVKEVRPLTLNDLAISDSVTLDKRTVASILGIPPFVLGIGEFKRDAWNNFVQTKISQIAMIIQQVLTRGLIYGENWFFRFNPRSLFAYDMRELAAIADDQYVRGIMTGNEVRDWLGMSPMDGMDDLIILENYIPRGMIGDQSKLTGGDKDDV